MPTATSAKSLAAKNKKPIKRTQRTVHRPAFQEPMIPAVDPDRPQEHNNIPVVREELMGNLPSGAKFKISKLHLSDGTDAFACRDCLYTGDTRADVMHHRNDAHGNKYGKKPPKVVFAKDPEPYELVLPPRSEGVPAPTNIMEMTVAELLALMPTIGALGDLVETEAHHRELAEVELDERRKHDRENGHKIAAYDSMHEELVERRMAMKGYGSFDEMKAELKALRAWKQKMTARLKTLGFVLTEEDEDQE